MGGVCRRDVVAEVGRGAGVEGERGARMNRIEALGPRPVLPYAGLGQPARQLCPLAHMHASTAAAVAAGLNPTGILR